MIHIWILLTYNHSQFAEKSILRLCLLFIIISGYMKHPSLPICVKDCPYFTWCRNTLQFVVPRAHSNQYKYSFLPLLIEIWNGLNFYVK